MNLIHRKLARRSASAFALMGAFAIAGCEDSNDPDPAVGTYVATSLVTTENGQPFNQIANGSTITLTLAPGGSASGSMHFEASGGDPDFDANLSGSWSRGGSTVTLNHSDDTFLNDMPLTFNGATLTGDATFDGVRIQLTLSRIGIAE